MSEEKPARKLTVEDLVASQQKTEERLESIQKSVATIAAWKQRETYWERFGKDAVKVFGLLLCLGGTAWAGSGNPGGICLCIMGALFMHHSV